MSKNKDKEFVNIKSDFTMRDARFFRRKMDEWEKKALKEGVPICLTCAHLDYQKGSLVDDWKNYSSKKEGFFIKLNTSRTIDRVKGEKIVRFMIDYKCVNNHGKTVSYSEEDYNHFFKKEKVEGKKKGKK